MLPFVFPSQTEPLKILCLGAHCDDIEIGCGGTLLELTGQRAIDCTWTVFCSDELRAGEAMIGAEYFLAKANTRKIQIESFRDGFLPYLGYQVKEYFEELKKQVSPDLIFTHYRGDKHQDHRLISELTLNTFRNHLILEYEIPKYDGDMGQPNLYIPISRENGPKKVTAIVDAYQSQHGRSWFTEDLFLSLLRIRGMEINASSRWAEAFFCHKMVMGVF